MGKKSLNLTDELYDYMLDTSLREPDILKRLREETSKMLMYAMQSPPEESQFIIFLLKLTGAKRILELGTFTGYTTLWMALTIPPDGKIITCDVDDKWTSKGRSYWTEAGVTNKIELRLAPAFDTMNTLMESGYANMFDFIFIDADKDNYVAYYEKALKLVRPGGIIAVDNVFWAGSVIDIRNQGSDVKEIRRLNKLIHEDKRVSASMLPVGDGLTLAIREL